MRRGFALLIGLLVLGEATAFVWQHRDVVALSRGADALAADAEFPARARRVLARDIVTRRVLEKIADAAGRRQDGDLQLSALERIAASAPTDRDVQLRLAEALRTRGRLDDAEKIYRAALAATTSRSQ